MSGPRTTHILFDFFGTLVDYSPSRTEQGFYRSHEIVRSLGAALTYEEFLQAWSTMSAQFDSLSAVDDHEYSMTELGTAFLRDVLGRTPGPGDVDRLVQAYLAEWNKGVRHLPGIAELLTDLAVKYRLAVVSNTQDTELVPRHLDAMGVRHLFDVVVTSVEVGWRKPHPKIYAAALDGLGIDPGAAVFVGDTYRADYHGPTGAGFRSLLIDPHQHYALVLPEQARLTSVFDLPARLGASPTTQHDANGGTHGTNGPCSARSGDRGETNEP